MGSKDDGTQAGAGCAEKGLNGPSEESRFCARVYMTHGKPAKRPMDKPLCPLQRSIAVRAGPVVPSPLCRRDPSTSSRL